MTVEAMTSGDWYQDSPELTRLRHWCARTLDRLRQVAIADRSRRDDILRELLGSIGERAEVVPTFRCSYGFNITIGADAFVNADAFFMDDAPIVVGPNARLGPSVQLMTALHPVDDHEMRRAGWERALGIEIGENAWLGAGVIVGPGVHIGKNTVVGAGSVVLKDLPAQVVAAGSPATVIRRT
ncbi:sugar O-acetyltransferase [Isoptericola croceus]|uniref:sugar O-acetyltransferase n=1 Tax=Isoptericola croceus TaxID=3031406 RepID=UPI0023F78105|nr:sugar O-acetyltransferase [Isoptericola croceus]